MSGCVGPGQEPGAQCGRTVIARGLCRSHYYQQWTDPDRPLRPIRERPERADADTERLIRETYAEMVANGYKPKRLRVQPKPCPRGNDPIGLLRCVGVAIEGVRLIDPHDAPVDEFGHHGGFCRQGRSRCRASQCRSCLNIGENLRHAVRRARHAGMTDAEIRAATPQKRCPKCRQTLSSDEFVVARSTTDGLLSHCRRCAGETQKRTVLPETVRAAGARRRARQAAATVEKFSEDELIEFWKGRGLDPDRCFYCDGPAEHVDHLVPLVLGGGHVMENLVPACQKHNLQKHAKHPLVFADPFIDWSRTEVEWLPDGRLEARYWRKSAEQIRREGLC